MDVEKLKAILEALKGTDVTRLTWAAGDESLDLRLGHPPLAPASMQAMPMAAPLPASAPQAAPAPAAMPYAALAAAAKAESDKKSFTINSPFVGTFYGSASPDS